jgi:hypothetical protein
MAYAELLPMSGASHSPRAVVTGNRDKALAAVRASVASPFVTAARPQDFDQLVDSFAPAARRATAHQ